MAKKNDLESKIEKAIDNISDEYLPGLLVGVGISIITFGFFYRQHLEDKKEFDKKN